MSYILDALKRAERERKQGQVSVLDEIAVAGAAEPPKPRLPQAWLIGLAALVLVCLPLSALLAWRHHSAREPAAASPAAVAAASGPTAVQQAAIPPAPAPVHKAATTPAATIEDGGRIATLDDVYGQAPPAAAQQPVAQQTTADVAAIRARVAAALSRPASGAAGDTAQPSAAPPAVTPDSQKADAGTTADAVGDSAAPTAADTAPDASAPADAAAQAQASPPAPSSQDANPAQRQLREMPEDFRANFPAFTVDVHAYNDNPQRRFIMIGGRRYHEGDALAQGPRIIAIVPEGMVLDWQGQRVLYAISR
jgi:general secretion pathway protein B